MNDSFIVALHPTDIDILNSMVNNTGDKDDECENLKLRKQNPFQSEIINAFDITRRRHQMEENVPHSSLHFMKNYENFYNCTIFEIKTTKHFRLLQLK